VFLALGKEPFDDTRFAVYPLPSVTLGKVFAECIFDFADCIRWWVKLYNKIIIMQDSIFFLQTWTFI
jgi:hypothetical protein